MKRREFIAGLGGAAALAIPGIAGAQQGERMRRVAVLMGWSETETYRSWFIAFVERLAQLGWTDGRNVRIEQRWTNADIDRTRAFANELIELQPDVILAGTTPVTAALRRATRTIPIIFVLVADPVGAGFVAGLPRPGGNITGFINVEAEAGVAEALVPATFAFPHFRVNYFTLQGSRQHYDPRVRCTWEAPMRMLIAFAIAVVIVAIGFGARTIFASRSVDTKATSAALSSDQLHLYYKGMKEVRGVKDPF
jgi:hypothetical protein